MKSNIKEYIDHTLLKPDATEQAILRICDEAKEYGFKSVCVNPSRIELVAERLKGTAVLPCCVIGFPLGATLSCVKAYEANAAIERGAKEIDIVINIGAAKDGDWNMVSDDIRAVVDASGGRASVKVIIETCLLTDDEKIKACECAMLSGADYVKTSTGFSSGGANCHDVELMRNVVGDKLGVKASGGVRTPEDAEKLIEAGASRLGTSNGIKLINR